MARITPGLTATITLVFSTALPNALTLTLAYSRQFRAKLMLE
jgi:hypothetical protein